MGRIIFIFYEVSLSLISLKIFFSSRDTCTWEIPSRPAITVWVIFSKYRIFMICCSFSPRPDKSSASTIRSRTLSFSDVFSAILSARQPPDSSPASTGS